MDSSAELVADIGRERKTAVKPFSQFGIEDHPVKDGLAEALAGADGHVVELANIHHDDVLDQARVERDVHPLDVGSESVPSAVRAIIVLGARCYEDARSRRPAQRRDRYETAGYFEAAASPSPTHSDWRPGQSPADGGVTFTLPYGVESYRCSRMVLAARSRTRCTALTPVP